MSGTFGLNANMFEYDPFSLSVSQEILSINSILGSLTSIFEVIKVFLDQQGIKVGGIQVDVQVAPKRVILLI
jgi:hypothetical protein